MTFWIIIFAISLLVVLILIRAMRQAAGSALPDQAEFDVQVYRDQLADVERDVARGVVPAEDAERIRTEISRRILAADGARGQTAAAGAGPQTVVMGFLVVVLISGSILMYRAYGAPGYGDLALADRIAFAEEMRQNRPNQETAERSLPPNPIPEGTSPDFMTLIEQLRATVSQRPDDLQGHILLAQNEARLGQFSAAARAQEQVLRIKGEAAAAEDITDLAELLILAAGGYVSPEAETALRAALVRDDQDGRARYYIGLMMLQTGRPDIAFRIWDTLLRRGPEDASWIAPIRAQILNVADLSGVEYSMPEIGTGTGTGPTLEDIEAASEMTAEDRMAMIGGMVDGLSNRLATEGGPPQDWARLITSLAILGNPDQALAVYTNALEVFEGNAGAIDVIRAAGSQAGVAE